MMEHCFMIEVRKGRPEDALIIADFQIQLALLSFC
jgi:hypothetical protein